MLPVCLYVSQLLLQVLTDCMGLGREGLEGMPSGKHILGITCVGRQTHGLLHALQLQCESEGDLLSQAYQAWSRGDTCPKSGFHDNMLAGWLQKGYK